MTVHKCERCNYTTDDKWKYNRHINRKNRCSELDEDGKKSKAEKAVTAASEWKRRYDYVMQVWLPAAQAQGMDPAQIQFVLNKIRDERPKTGVAKELTSGYGG